MTTLSRARRRVLPVGAAEHVLASAKRALARGGRLFVFGEVLDPVEADEHDLEEDLVALALTGGAVRDDAAHRALFAAAGLSVQDRRTVGWGFSLFELG